jgi:hypothetical protein
MAERKNIRPDFNRDRLRNYNLCRALLARLEAEIKAAFAPQPEGEAPPSRAQEARALQALYGRDCLMAAFIKLSRELQRIGEAMGGKDDKEPVILDREFYQNLTWRNVDKLKQREDERIAKAMAALAEDGDETPDD